MEKIWTSGTMEHLGYWSIEAENLCGISDLIEKMGHYFAQEA